MGCIVTGKQTNLFSGTSESPDAFHIRYMETMSNFRNVTSYLSTLSDLRLWELLLQAPISGSIALCIFYLSAGLTVQSRAGVSISVSSGATAAVRLPWNCWTHLYDKSLLLII